MDNAILNRFGCLPVAFTMKSKLTSSPEGEASRTNSLLFDNITPCWCLVSLYLARRSPRQVISTSKIPITKCDSDRKRCTIKGFRGGSGVVVPHSPPPTSNKRFSDFLPPPIQVKVFKIFNIFLHFTVSIKGHQTRIYVY